MLVGSDNYRSQMELQICVTILYSSSRIVVIKNKNLKRILYGTHFKRLEILYTQSGLKSTNVLIAVTR